MKLKLTKYGWPEVAIYPSLIIAAMALAAVMGLHRGMDGIVITIEAVLGIVLVWMLSFFRDPYRQVPADKNLLIAPADGTVTDTDVVDAAGFDGGKAIRVGIFLSIFNVHINRSPCDALVSRITYKMGYHKDARDKAAGQVNEANELELVRKHSGEKVVVRQISGAIARRIVCQAKVGQELEAGEKFGMIKFGSRTEIYIPANANVQILVKTGKKVKAGTTALARFGQEG